VSALTLYRFLQVRVIFNVIAESIETGLKPYVFRPIDGRGRLAEEIKTSISQLLWTLWNDDVLFGSSPEDAYLVKVDMSNRSQLEAGILNVDVYAKPTPIAERINVTLYRVPLAFDFRTGKVTVGSIEEEAA
jgi:phage tail sheath protein FI